MDELKKKDQPDKKPGFKPWLKKIGLAGVLFFLIKGLVWLAIFFGIGSFIEC